MSSSLVGNAAQRVLAAGVCLAVLGGAIAVPVASAQSTPLVDRQLFFGDPEISGSQLSPNGRFLSFVKPYKGTRNVWVKGIDEPFSAARPVTADMKRPVAQYFWSRDSRYVLFVQDQGGDENFNVYAVDPTAAPAADTGVPAARNITDAKGVRAFIYAVPKSDPDAIFVGFNDRDPAWHDLYKVKISTGERTLLRKNTDRLTGWVFDLSDQLRLATRSADSGATEVLRVDAEAFTKVYECTVFETCAPFRFHKDGKRVYMASNKGDADLVRLTLFDPATGAEAIVETDPQKRVDLGNALFSEVTNELVATVYEDERTRYVFHDTAFESDYKALQARMPGFDLSFQSSTADEQKWIVVASSDVEPAIVSTFDRKTKGVSRLYQAREALPRDALSPMKAITYRSSDGLDVPAFLTLPKGLPAKNLPLVVFPHGGPWARDGWGYDGSAQFLANRGYAVLQPNFRGSTGYGKKFLDAGNKQWGEKMQDDLTWGVKHLVDQGMVDGKRVAIMGGSYGGYATLAGVAFTPDVYAAAVSIVGPSNLITLLDSIPPYWEAGRKQFYERMGDPTTPAGKAQLERQSPLNSAAKIKTPLLVVQGANDPRVKKAESDQIVIALRDRGFPVEYLVAPDEGHGFARPINNLAMYATIESFLAKHIGGRAQQDRPADVAKRLEEITVDPRTVVLAKPVDTASVGAPRPAVPLKPTTEHYGITIALNGQTLQMATETVITEEGGDIVIVDTATTPMGKAVDTVRLDKTTLVLKKRTVAQGPVAMSFEVTGSRARGEVKVSESPRVIDFDLGGPLFADGAGAYHVLATLPLAEGYTTSFRNFDAMGQKTRVLQLKVSGTESVTVPAGTFEAMKVELTNTVDAARSTIYVSTSDRRVVKIESVAPQMNGAILTAELK